ncbi:MAG: acetylxylan esterase [Calditrichaeota bacterium]|nr:MAG: acetylxylan esterase [Calditrichota bacterium]
MNYDEAKVPVFDLPDPLILADETPVLSSQIWLEKKRPEILTYFEEQVYGRAPRWEHQITFQIREQQRGALDGTALRRQVRIYLLGSTSGPFIDLLIYLPAGLDKPAPLFVGLNFYGNQTIIDDPAIFLPESWVDNEPEYGITDHKATEASRGVREYRWPVRQILARGYGVAAIYYGDIDPDDEGRFDNGIHPWFYQPGQTHPAADEWGAIAAWAWGLSRAMDYFQLDADIAADRVIVMGHSRLGKTALWAGATDQRFAMAISNNSGCGGAALSKRRFGETVKIINTVFPHWFCDNFNAFNDQEEKLEVDQHELIALMAPRPVYVASAQDDLWADPRGEFLAAQAASPVYQLFGLQGLPTEEMPAVNTPVMGTIGYHIRTGVHDVTLYDWEQFMHFADLHGMNR